MRKRQVIVVYEIKEIKMNFFFENEFYTSIRSMLVLKKVRERLPQWGYRKLRT